MTIDSSNSLPPKIQLSKSGILVSYYGLLAYFTINTVFVFEGLRLASIVIWLLQVLPLLMFIPGIRRGHLRTCGWMCFVVLLYFMHGVLVAFAPGRLWFGLIETLLCVTLFFFLIVYIRQYREYYQVSL